ncbi:hypothetical protein AAVH_26609 [Aphelenchoides avenae]|nr:hypothetical protein AAVH_26609 [Aphelenchus avenae]
MPLLEEVLLEILQCLNRFCWDTLEIVSRALKNAVRASINSRALVHYRRIDEVGCTGCDMLLNVQVGGTTYTFDVLDRGVLHYAFVNKFLIGSTSAQHPTMEFALALPNAVRTVAVGTLIFEKMLFCRWKRDGDFYETDSSVFDGLVMSFERVLSLGFNGTTNSYCLVKPDYLTDDFIRRCKLKGMRRFDALLCNTDANAFYHRPSFDISPDAIVDFLAGPEGDDQVVVFKLGFVCRPIAVLQRLILAFEQGRIPQRFEVAFSGHNRQLRLDMRESYAAFLTEEKSSSRGPTDMYHIPSVDIVLFVLDRCLLATRHMDLITNKLTFDPHFDY